MTPPIDPLNHTPIFQPIGCGVSANLQTEIELFQLGQDLFNFSDLT